jgi:hypothetical protein
MVSDGGLLWLYCCGTRQDGSGNWASVGKVQVAPQNYSLSGASKGALGILLPIERRPG